MKYLILDFETSISDTIHGPSAMYLKNDIHTVIAKERGKPLYIEHKAQGFARQLPVSLASIDVIVGHNLKFDLLYIWKDPQFQAFLQRGGYVWDTQVAEYLLTGQRHKISSLASLQDKYLGHVEKPSRISKLFQKGIGADKILSKTNCRRLHKLYHNYCESDGLMTEEVFLGQYKRAEQEGMLPIIELYNRYLLSLTMMEHNGMPFDLDKVERKAQEYNLKSLEYLKQIRDIVNPLWPKELPEFNPGSGNHLSWIFFGGTAKYEERQQQGFFNNGNPRMKWVELTKQIKGMGIKATKKLETKKAGIYKCNQKVLEKIAKSRSTAGTLANLVLEMRTVKQLASTYFPSYLKRQINGYVHPTYNNTQTVTGRLSCSSPNFQNIPKGGEVESLISPISDGWTCVSIDYSQLEVYVLAYLSGCQRLIDDIESGRDQHCLSLSYVVGKSYEEVKKLADSSEEWANKRKKLGKPITFGIQYGASAGTIAKNAGLSIEEAETVLSNYYADYPEVKNFFDLIREDVEKSSTLCKQKDVDYREHKVSKTGRRFGNDIELLPIKDWGTGDNTYDTRYPRHIGYHTSLTGRKYGFESDGSVGAYNKVREVFRQPIIQNYVSQGTAGDVQCASSVSMFKSLLKHRDKIRLINEIHDSKWFIIKNEYLDVLIPRVVWHMEKGFRKTMKDILDIDFPADLKVDVEIGPNFADLQKYKVTNEVCRQQDSNK